MVHSVFEEDGNLVTLLDAEAIDYFIEGLTALRACMPGEEMFTPSVEHEDESLVGIGDFILRRAADS
jgi:hypothetical protein